jgi:pyridoxal phosphate enzyme (YggS family)
MSDTIEQRIARVRERITEAARHAGRSPDEVTLVAVTKTHPPEAVAAALAAGIADMGENRVQEASEKIVALAAQREAIRWHLIGHLQRNKARLAAELFDMVHSLDSLRLAEALARHTPAGRALDVLLQVNVSGEASKEGFDLPGGVENSAALPAFLADVGRIVALPGLRVRGLMTVAPWGSDREAARPTFRALRLLRDELARRFPQGDWSQLSMGMTDDFAVAIAEGATIVRVGRAIFGEREPQLAADKR